MLAVLDPEVVRIIASRLAAIGDQFDKEINARVVNDLVQQFLNENLSRQVSEKQPSKSPLKCPSCHDFEAASL